MYKDIHVHIWPYTDTFRERLAHTSVYTQWYIHRHIDRHINVCTYRYTDSQCFYMETQTHKYTEVQRDRHIYIHKYT